MSAVLVAVVNGEKVVDSGTGILIGVRDGASYVLTCAHNLKAIAGDAGRTEDGQAKVRVHGAEAEILNHEELASRDLTVLKVPAVLTVPQSVLFAPSELSAVKCVGFVPFFQGQFERVEITGTAVSPFETVSPDGDFTGYYRITPPEDGVFAKGMSGGPVVAGDVVVGVARILERGRSKDAPMTACAIRLSDPIIGWVRELVPLVAAAQGVEPDYDPDRPPPAPAPDPKSVAKKDIQKNRWGRKAAQFGRRLGVENVTEHSTVFEFDAVLESTDGPTLKPPFVFYLHDTFTPHVYWIRKTDGKRAVLAGRVSHGTFTIGVQFKDKDGVWRSAEYDLEHYKRGELKKYD
jgi:hypothetical protein